MPKTLAIVKVQRHQDVPKSVKNALGDDMKGYFEATREPMYGAWVIGKRVEDQDW